MTIVDAAALRRAIPEATGILVRRGADFASAEDAVRTALVRALERADLDEVRDIRAWLVTVAWRAFLDQVRSDTARATREERLATEPENGPVPQRDDTLALYFLCTHPALTAPSSIALVQIVEWYNELLRLGDSPVIRLGRAVAIGEADGPHAGLAALDAVDAGVPRFHAALAYMQERAGKTGAAASEYAEAARRATSILEQQHLLLQAERLRGSGEEAGCDAR